MGISFYIGIIILAGVFVSKILRKLKFPNVTGYLIAGVLIGHNILNIVPKNIVDELNIISDVALGFIAFSIGSSFRLVDLKRQGKSTIIITLMESLVAMLLVFLAMVFILKEDVAFALMISSIACATAPAATLMVIRQYNAKGPLVDTLLPVVALDDAVSIMAFGISTSVVAAHASGAANLAVMFVKPIIEILLALGIGSAFGVLLVLFLKKSKSQGNYINLQVAMIFICIALASYLKVSSLLMCMALGAMIANLMPNPSKCFSMLDQISTPIFLAFFTISGAALNLEALVSVGAIGLCYLTVRCLGKWLGGYTSCKLCKKEPQVTKYIGFALFPQAGVALGLSLTAANLIGGDHGAKIRTVILATTVVYELAGPLLAKFALKKAGEIKPETKTREVKTA